MSAKRSWDIQVVKKDAKNASRRPTKLTAKPVGGTMPLRARRRKARKRLFIIGTIVVLVLIGLVIYGLHRPEVRVREVVAVGAHEEAIPKVALESMRGSYYYLAPRDSIFFYPEGAVRSAVLKAFPDVSAVSINWNGFSSIEISVIARAKAFSWCGASLEAPASTCYEADGEGFVYAPTGNSPTLLRIYAPLKDGATEPIGSIVEAANSVPLALQFVRAVESLGAPIEALALRGDEVDLVVEGSGTKLTYILGHEVEAAGLAATVLPTLSLTDGSIEYLDLRFSGKAYVKRKGAEAPVTEE